MKINKEKISGAVFFISALSALSALALITIFIFIKGVPIIAKVGLFNFVFGMVWDPGNGLFGIFPMIFGSVTVTLGAALLGVPVAISCSIFLSEFAPVRLSNIIRPAIQLLAAIPSVVYGFWGLLFVVPAIRNYLGGPGLSILAGSIILAIMILPTIINVSEDAIRAVAPDYKEASLALGATHWQTISRIIVPAASSGIGAAVVLGMGRAVGETMAVIMVAGNSPIVPGSIFSPLRSLTGNIALEMAYSSGEHTQALFFTGIVLFVMIMLINTLAIRIMKRGKKA